VPALAVLDEHGHRVTGHRRKEARVIGYEYLHVAIDDHSRISFAALLPDQSHRWAIHFFLIARAHFRCFGITIRRVYSDNGSCYRHWLYRKLMNELHLKQRFTRPYTPHTNGKAERFIQTALREWAYARSYQNSAEREEQLEYWLHDYNFHRPPC
jgi:transposase InsO family protein